MVPEVPAAPVRHTAKFYNSDSSLYETVAAFLAEGLLTGHPAVVIATPRHREGIEASLSARRIDVAKARRYGDLLTLDAEDTLGSFMMRERPNPELFDLNVGGVLTQVARGRGPVQTRAYGEMVDVLWKQRRPEAAVELEMLWNKLAHKQAEHFTAVCRQHSHIIPAESVASADGAPAGSI